MQRPEGYGASIMLCLNKVKRVRINIFLPSLKWKKGKSGFFLPLQPLGNPAAPSLVLGKGGQYHCHSPNNKQRGNGLFWFSAVGESKYL